MQAFEESVFLNLPAVRDSSQPLANTTDVPDITDDKSARLNGSDANRRIGPAKMMVVSAGDQINVTVDSYHAGSYTNNGYQTQATIAAALAGVLSAGTSSATEATGITNLVNGLPSSTAVFAGASGTQNRPKAYLNVLIFDQDFNYKDGAFVQTDQASGYKTLSINKTVAEGGYVYVYLSNESQTDFNVFFDDLQIDHVKGNILQEDHYYPFGMAIAAISSNAPLSKPNHFKYNGFEQQTDFNLGWYDYQARYYDPQLGRFMQVDPAADLMRRHSPYNYAFDNPIRFIDPDGMMPDNQVDDEYGQQQRAETAAMNSSHDNQFGFGSNGMGNTLDHSSMSTHKQDKKNQDKKGKTEKPDPTTVNSEGLPDPNQNQDPLRIVPVDLSQPGAYDKILRNLELAFWKMRNEGTEFHLDDIVDLSTSFPNALTEFLGPVTGTSWGTASTRNYYFGDIQVRLYVNPMPEFAESELNILDENGKKPTVLRYNKEGRSSLLYDVDWEDPAVENGYYYIRARNWHEDGIVTFRTSDLDRALKIYKRLVSPQEYNNHVKEYNKK